MVAYKEKTLFQRVNERQEYYEKLREPWEASTDKIIEIYRPDMFTYNSYKTMGENTKIDILGKKIYEGTGAFELRLMSEGFQGNLVNESEPWFCHVIDEQKLKGNDDVNQYLQEFDEQLYSVYRKSSFYPNLTPYTRHGLSVGSPVMVIEEDDQKSKIECIIQHPCSRYLNQNRFGVTDVLHVKEFWTIRKAIKIFGKEKFSDHVKNAYDNGKDKEKVTIIRGIYFYLDEIFEDLPKKYKPLMPWVSVYVEQKSSENETLEPLQIKGYNSKPFVVWHYEKDPSLIYSFTPAWYSYYDVQAMQAVRKTIIKAGQIMIEPPWWAPAYLKGIAKFYPKGINWYLPNQSTMKPESLTKDIRFPDFNIELENRMAESVRRWFYSDMWLMISRLALEKAQPVTAYQIMNIIGERALLLGPRVGCFLGAIKEIDDRIIEIEQLAGRLPIPPDIIINESNGIVNPEFIGPLAQIQKQYQSSKRIQTALAMAEPFLNLDPMTRYKIIAEKALEHVLEENKFFQDCIRSDDEYKEILSTLAQQAAQEKMLAAGSAIADAVPKLSKPIAAGSPVEMMAGAMD